MVSSGIVQDVRNPQSKIHRCSGRLIIFATRNRLNAIYANCLTECKEKCKMISDIEKRGDAE